MTEFVQQIAEAMSGALGAPLAVFLLSMIPIAEARFAIPFGMSMGLEPWESFGWAFLGSTMLIPILLLVLIPIINALSKTKAFSKLGKFLYDKFYSKSRALEIKDGTVEGDAAKEPSPDADADTSATDGAKKPKKKKNNKPLLTKTDLKKMGGTALFVAVPLPLTGVWTGSAVASIVKIGFVKALIGVTIGNAVACGIITLISWLFAPYVEWITLAFFIIAVIVVIVLVIKLIIYKPKDVAAKPSTEENSNNITENSDETPSRGIDNNVADDSPTKHDGD